MQSRAWYVLAKRAVYVLAFVPALASLLLVRQALATIDANIEAMPRMVIPGGHTFDLPAGDLVIYGESRGNIYDRTFENENFTFESPCTLVDEAERSVELDPISIHNAAKYRRNGRLAKAMFDVTIAKAGRYTLACEGDGTGDAVLAIGPSVRRALALPLLVFGGTLALGVVGCVLLYSRRRKAVQRARE